MRPCLFADVAHPLGYQLRCQGRCLCNYKYVTSAKGRSDFYLVCLFSGTSAGELRVRVHQRPGHNKDFIPPPLQFLSLRALSNMQLLLVFVGKCRLELSWFHRDKFLCDFIQVEKKNHLESGSESGSPSGS